MLRLVGIIILCLSTLASPAVHAAASAPGLLHIGSTIGFDGLEDCGGAVLKRSAMAPPQCLSIGDPKAEAQRCQIAMMPLSDETRLNVPVSAGLIVQSGHLAPAGITLAPPHGPPRSAFSDQIV